MKSVLVVDDDRVLLDALALELSRLGYAARTAASVDEAVDQLATRPADVLVTDLRMRGRDGIDLLRACREMHPRTRMVLMSAYATARDYKVARSVGAVEVLVKPFAPEEFAEAVRRAETFDAGFQADVLGLTLVDVLQLFHHGRRTVSVRVGETGVVHMKEGEIIHATTPTAAGPTALIEILSVEGGVISTGAPEQVPRTFTRPFETLLLGTLALIDERRASRPVHDGDVFTSARPQAIEPGDPPSRPSGSRMRGPSPTNGHPRLMPASEPATAPPPALVSGPAVPVTTPRPPVTGPATPVPAISAPRPVAPPERSRGLGLALAAVFVVVLLLTLGRDPKAPAEAPMPPGQPVVRVTADEVVGVGAPDAPAPSSQGPQVPWLTRPVADHAVRPADVPAPPEPVVAPPSEVAPVSIAAPIPAELVPAFPATDAPEAPASVAERRPVRVVRVERVAPGSNAERPVTAEERPARVAPRSVRGPAVPAPATAAPAPPSAAPETPSRMPQVEILDEPAPGGAR